MNPDALTTFDAYLASQARTAMPTALDTAGLRELGAGVLARSVFTARGTNAIFASKLKEVVDAMASGELGERQAKAALAQTLDALGYDSEQGGFAGEEVPAAVRGSIQDLRSFNRLDLIVSTQMDLMEGAGFQMRGHTPDRLLAFPAWELVRLEEKTAPRNWDGQAPTKADPRSRWSVAGGTPYDGRMIAFKGDPVWGELGAWENFADALGVDHPPFAFRSGMWWQEIERAECDALGVRGPNGESRQKWFANPPLVMAGKLPLPTPQISMKDVDPAILAEFTEATGATEVPTRPGVFSYQPTLEAALARRDAERAARDEAQKQAEMAERSQVFQRTKP